MKKKNKFRFSPFSKRQRQLLNWWVPGSPVESASGIIADGAIRSGKTLCMCISFVMWALTAHDGETLGMCGKTIGSFRRNVLGPMKQALPALGYEITDKRADNLLIIKKGRKSAEFYIFGGRDERSQDLIQGITLAGIFLDEVVLMPRSFVEQAIGRCSVENSKIWMNCNPGNAGHWIKKEWIDQHKEKRMLYLHFTMDDNTSLSREIRARYRRLYVGTWFRRYILGEWVAADGLIYDMIDTEADTVDTERIAEEYQKKNGKSFWRKTFVSVDYGTSNATAALLWSLGRDNTWYIRREYYHSGRDSGRQKTDRQYSQDIIRWLNDDLLTLDVIIVDPAAASFKVQLEEDGLETEDADNAVLDGIRETSSGLGNGEIKIDKGCDMLLEEISGYVWDSTAAKNGVEKPVKQNDHACDAMRYGWMHVIDGLELETGTNWAGGL